ncbi:MAG: hypothetical protein K2Q01_00585, partial [Rickettsiales bacterium]|nr:hypothetical protein [Rickettsiales bacterium]
LHKHEVDSAPESERVNRMVEANVKQQLMNLAKTTIIQKAWKNNKRPHLHGWVYDMSDGIVKPLLELEPHQSIDDPIYTYDPYKE